MKTAKDRAMYILASVGKDKESIEIIEREFFEYAKYYTKKQMNKCKMAYSANRHKSPQDIKDAIVDTLITEFE